LKFDAGFVTDVTFFLASYINQPAPWPPREAENAPIRNSTSMGIRHARYIAIRPQLLEILTSHCNPSISSQAWEHFI